MLKLPALRSLTLGVGPAHPKPAYFSLVDLGADTIKTAVVKLEQDHVNVLGHSLVPAQGRDVAGGRAQAAALAGVINGALKEAEDASEQILGYKAVPDHVLFSLPGRTIAGGCFTVHQKRPHSAAPITAKEFDTLWERALRLTRQGLPTLPRVSRDWLPQTITGAGLWLDNHLVNDPVGLKGKTLSLAVYGFICHPAIIRGLEQLADKLELEIYHLVPAPQSLAMIVPAREALVLDVGAGGTDCSLLRHDVLVAADRVSMGGAFFTHALSRRFKCELDAAEALKIAFATGALSQTDEKLVRRALRQPLKQWAKAIGESLAKMLSAGSRPTLPGKIYLAGGSAMLPGLQPYLRQSAVRAGLTFERAPEFFNLGETTLPGFQHQPAGFRGMLFSLALSLAGTI